MDVCEIYSTDLLATMGGDGVLCKFTLLSHTIPELAAIVSYWERIEPTKTTLQLSLQYNQHLLPRVRFAAVDTPHSRPFQDHS